jgi:hypothetical protein
MVFGFADSQKQAVNPERRLWESPLYIKEIGCESINWINVADDRDQWRALVYTVM